MRPVKIEGENHSFGKPRDWDPAVHGECATLSVRLDQDERGPHMTSKWELEPADLEALMKGGSIYLRIYGTAHPVVSVYVAGQLTEQELKI